MGGDRNLTAAASSSDVKHFVRVAEDVRYRISGRTEPRTYVEPQNRLKLQVAQAPFNSGVGDTEALPLRVALRNATGFSADHCEIAAGPKGILEAACKQYPLRPPAAPLGDSTCPGEQSDAVVDGKRARSNRLPAQLHQKAGAVLSGRGNAHKVADEVGDFSEVAPALSCCLSPKLTFVSAHNPHLESLVVHRDRWNPFAQRQEHHLAQLHGLVTSLVEHRKCSFICKRAHFMEHGRFVIFEKRFEFVHAQRRLASGKARARSFACMVSERRRTWHKLPRLRSIVRLSRAPTEPGYRRSSHLRVPPLARGGRQENGQRSYWGASESPGPTSIKLPILSPGSSQCSFC